MSSNRLHLCVKSYQAIGLPGRPFSYLTAPFRGWTFGSFAGKCQFAYYWTTGHHRWLTVVAEGDTSGVELLLEPDVHPAAEPFKEGLLEDGIPATTYGVWDVHAKYEHLCGWRGRFTQPPVFMEPVTTTVLDDTCGSLIQIAQKHERS